MDDLEVPLFLETPIFVFKHLVPFQGRNPQQPAMNPSETRVYFYRCFKEKQTFKDIMATLRENPAKC